MSPKQELLCAFGGIPELDDLIPHPFLQRFDLAARMQYGMLCKDVRAGIEQLEALGAGPFLYCRDSRLDAR